MKSCRFENLLLPYMQDELAKEDRLRLSSHLGTCQNCRDVLEGLKGVDNALQHYRRAEAPRDLYASYVQQLDTRFKPEPALKKGWRWLKLAVQPFVSPSPSWRIARAAATLLVGVLLGRALFHQPQMASTSQLAAQVTLTKEDVQFIANYVVQSELLLLTIANSATDEPTDDDIYLNKDIAQNLLFKTAQVQRKAVALQDDLILTFFNHLELVLLEISNRDDDEIRATFRDIKNMIIESDMVQKSRRLQHRLETTLAESA